MGQHRPLGAAGGAGGVEDAGQVVGAARDVGEDGLRPGGEIGQGPLPRRVQGLDRRAARDLRHAVPGGRGADHQGGLGVPDEIVELGQGVGGVEGQIDRAGPQGRQIEQDRGGRLLDLHGHPVAGLYPKPDQGVGVAGRSLDHGGVVETEAAGDLQERAGGRGGRDGGEAREQVFGHGLSTRAGPAHLAPPRAPRHRGFASTRPRLRSLRESVRGSPPQGTAASARRFTGAGA